MVIATDPGSIVSATFGGPTSGGMGFGGLLAGGLLGGGLSGLFGGGGGAGREAAQLQAASLQNAIDELRRQFGITQENIAPFMEAGQGAVPGLTEASTIGGLNTRLNQIFDTDIFDALVDERMRGVQSQLAATGQSRSGLGLQEAARVPMDVGLSLENMLNSRSQNLAGSGQNAALGLGALGQQNATNIAGLTADIGRSLGSGILTDAQADAAQTQQLLNTAATAGAIFFSDPKLKENIHPLGMVKTLMLYSWDWIPEALNTVVGKFPTIGFLSTEVREQYPHLVDKYCGFDIINIKGVLNELEAA